MKLTLILTILLIFVNKALLLNILVVLPYNGLSHFIVFDVLVKELANRGHSVTVISHFQEKDSTPKYYKNINLPGSNNTIEGAFEMKTISVFEINYYLTMTGIHDCEIMLANKEVQSLIRSKQKFDVVVVEQFNSDCALGMVFKLGAPVVGMTTSVLMPYYFQRLGIPDNPSYVSHNYLGGGTKPTFIQRLEKVFFKFYYNILYYFTQWMNQRTLAKYFDNIPSLEQLGREIKFLLLYQNFMMTGSNLYPANVIEVGGFHVKKTKLLTGELRNFIEEADDGLVYVSFGTLLNSSTLLPEKVQAIVEAMKEFPQRFIWKMGNDTFIAVKNKLYISSWLPQSDILGHPKTLAFLSHGGMLGTTEAMHFGVPMIVMPFFGDQFCNAAAIAESGFGIELQYKDLTKENLVAALKKVLDPEFNKRAQEISRAWHDRPVSPLDTAVFWTEFAAKHPNFTYRTAAADVPMYQYLLLDVVATLVVALGIFGYVIKSCCRCRTKQQDKKMKTKRQ